MICCTLAKRITFFSVVAHDLIIRLALRYQAIQVDHHLLDKRLGFRR